MTVPHECILHYRRHRTRPDAGGDTLFCTVTRDGGLFGVLGHPTPDRFPDFDGETAWFRVRWFRKGRFEVLGQVADREGRPLADVTGPEPGPGR